MSSPWGRATTAATSYPRAVIAPIASSKTYPAIVKSEDLYVAACGVYWWFRGVDVVLESRGRMMHWRNIGSRVPRRLTRLRAATFGMLKLKVQTVRDGCLRQWTDTALYSCLIDATGPGQAPRQPGCPATSAFPRQWLTTPRRTFYSNDLLLSTNGPPQLYGQASEPAKFYLKTPMEAFKGCSQRDCCAKPSARGTAE